MEDTIEENYKLENFTLTISVLCSRTLHDLINLCVCHREKNGD